MALAIATSPVIANGALNSSQTVSAAFNIPVRSLLIVCVAANSAVGGSTTSTISDNKGKSWAFVDVANFASLGQSGYSTIYAAYSDTAETGMVVTVNTAGSDVMTRRSSFKVFVVTGAHKTLFGASSQIVSDGNNVYNGSFVQTIANSMLFIAACEWNKRGVPTSTNLTGDFFDQTTSPGISGAFGYRLLDGTTGPEPYNLDAAAALAARWNVTAFEVRPAVVPTVSAGVDVAAHTAGAVFARTGADSDGGSLVTAREWRVTAGPAAVNTVLSTTSDVSFQPTVLGVYTLRYQATNDIGTTTDTMTLTVVPPVGRAFMQGILPAGTLLSVEIAWGANLTADPGTWTWTDVTEDAYLDVPLSIKTGRGDEASESQPASLSLTLNNNAFKYSLGAQSPNYPNVRRNTPVRVRIDYAGSGMSTAMFQGFAVGFTPSWNVRGNVRTVELVAAGSLRRLIQGSSPLFSPLRRALSADPSIVAYWPIEDEPGTTVIAPVIGSTGMRYNLATPAFQANTTVDSSAPMANFNGAVLSAEVDTYADTGEAQVRVLFDFPKAGIDPVATDALLFSVFTSGTIAKWNIYYVEGGDFYLTAENRARTIIYNFGPVGFGVNGTSRYYSLGLTQSGSNIAWALRTISPYTVLGFVSGTINNQTFGIVKRIQLNEQVLSANPGVIQDTGVGHVSVHKTIVPVTEARLALDAYASEYYTDRLNRLAAENATALTRISGTSLLEPLTDRMGPQRIDALVSLLRECEKVDQGILYDGYNAGLTYRSRRATEEQAAIVTIDAGDLKLSPPFGPMDDDQRTRNKILVKRYKGSSALGQDVTGPMGTNAVGIYDSSVDLNAYLDDSLPLFAGWFLSRGTLEGYRYPVISIDIGANPTIAPSVLNLQPGTRLQITNINNVLPGHPIGTVDLLVEGLTHTLQNKTWRVELVCSSFRVWKTGVLTDTASATDPNQINLDTDGSTLQANAAIGATSISVTTVTGPLWTTTSTDYPFTLEIGGFPVVVTNCADGTSPQVMTVAPLQYNLTAGMTVRLWEPAVLGL